MKPSASLDSMTAGAKEILAAKSAYFISGFAFSTWVVMIPDVKQRLAIEADALGLLLLCIGVAACIAMPAAGVLTRYITCRALIFGASVLAAVMFLLVPLLPSYWLYVPVLLSLGASAGLLDVGINLNGVLVERISGRRIMSAMHAFYSIGCFVAAGSFSVLAEYVALPLPAIAAVHAALVAAILLLFGRSWLPYRAGGGQKSLAIPRGAVILFGIMGGLGFLAEGGIMDWGGVLLTEEKGVAIAFSGMGFTVYSVAALLARLVGDRMTKALGERVIIIGGCAGALVSFAAISFVTDFTLLMALFFSLGLFIANVIPQLYSLLEHQHDMPLATAVTALTSMGYAGVLLGPSFLGFVAKHFRIDAVFDLLALLMVIQIALTCLVFRKLK